ncbi:MAG: extracellular solute-binding protein [Clostridia bacterium]|nr:extracellular solute-binding protein [Clostridia bacterium]
MRRILALLTAWMLGLCIALPAKAASERLTVMVYDRGNVSEGYGTVTDNAWTRYLQQQALTRLEINVQYVGVSRSNDLEQLNLMLAGNNPPDIMFTYDYAFWLRLCENGLVCDLTDAVQRYGSHLKANQGSVLPYGQYAGRQYGICNQRASVSVTSGFIREDWLDALGIQPARSEEGYLLLTAEELLDIMRAFREADLNGSHGGPVFFSYGSTYWPVLLMLEAFYDQEALTDEDLYSEPFFLFEGAKEGYRYLNGLFSEGLMNQDFAFLGDSDKSQYIESIVSGQAGVWINDSWFGFSGDGTLEALYAQDPNAKVAAFDLLNSRGDPAYKYAYSDYGMICFVPRLSAHAEAAVKYLDLLSDQSVDFVLRYGFENEHYIMEDGLPYPLEKEGAEERIHVADLALMYNGCSYLEGDAALSIQMLPENLRPLRRQSESVGKSNSFQVPTLPETVSVSQLQAESLDALERELRFRTIMCSPEDFDRTWEMCVNAYLEAGGQELMEHKRSVYRELTEQ